jgi:hypothetical protein
MSDQNSGIVINQSSVSKVLFGMLALISTANHDFGALFLLTVGGGLVHYMDCNNIIANDADTLRVQAQKLAAILANQFGHVDFVKLQQDLRGLVGQNNTSTMAVDLTETPVVTDSVSDVASSVAAVAETIATQQKPVVVQKPSRPESSTDAVA